MPSITSTVYGATSLPQPTKRVPYPHLVDTTYDPVLTVYPTYTEYTVTLPQSPLSGLRQLLAFLNPLKYLPIVPIAQLLPIKAISILSSSHSTSDPPLTSSPTATQLPISPPTPSHAVFTSNFSIGTPKHPIDVDETIDRTKTLVFRVRHRSTFLIIFYSSRGIIKGQSVFEVEDAELDIESGGTFKEESYWSWSGRRWRVVLRFDRMEMKEGEEGRPKEARRRNSVGGKVTFELLHCLEGEERDLERGRYL